MDENTEENPRDGNTILSPSGTRQTNQTLPKDTMNRTADRTCTQKLIIPTLAKHDHTSANLWWRKFVQYIKMTKEIDLSTMTNNKEILTQYRDQLETEIKDIFIWAIGQNAITEMTKTIREREPSSLPLYKLYTLFRLHFTPERNVQHSRADFFDLKREDGESAADVWKRILEIEKKNCEFETITAAELLASKFLSVIGKSTGDYDLKKKIRKSDMSVEAITDAILEYTYDKLNDSPETEEEKKIRYLIKRKIKPTNEQPEKPTKVKKVDCNRCGAPNWSRQPECPARGKKCANCGKIGHFAKCCRTNKRVNHIMEEETSSANEDDWTPNTIHSVKQKIHSTRSINSNGPDFFTITALVNNRPIKFIIGSGSQVTLIPKSLLNNITQLHPLKTEYRDVNDNCKQFEGKTMAKVEIDGKQKEQEILVTTKRTNPILGLDWMKKLGITLETDKTVPQIQQTKKRPRHNIIENEIQETFHRKPYSKWTGSKDTTERRRETDTTERKANTDSPPTIGGEGNRKTKKTRTYRKSQQYRRKLLRKSSRDHGKEKQINKNRPRFAKIECNNREKKGTNA